MVNMHSKYKKKVDSLEVSTQSTVFFTCTFFDKQAVLKFAQSCYTTVQSTVMFINCADSFAKAVILLIILNCIITFTAFIQKRKMDLLKP